MEITSQIISRRNEALLIGDYGTYRKHLSRRLLTLHRKLGRTSQKGRPYAEKALVTSENVSANTEFAHLLLLTSERAWAQAMYMKSTHSTESATEKITGSTKKHIASRLHKAAATAEKLVELLRDTSKSIENTRATAEARAYYCMLLGTQKFEARNWEQCLIASCEAHLVYTALVDELGPGHGDAFREMLSSTVDPSIRYAAYQLQLPRSISIDKIVSRFITKKSVEVRDILSKNPNALKEGIAGTDITSEVDVESLPKTISWRSRTVELEDANIAQALASLSSAEQQLLSIFSPKVDMTSVEKAAAYDGVLNPSQDAVDATKTAIDELTADGVAQGDPRMQALQVTRTAVSYTLVGWRIGRNRVLCGKYDGAFLEFVDGLQPKKRKKNATSLIEEESNGKKLARLKERVALYDTTIQSLDFIKELPGTAADQLFLDEIDSKRRYFVSLRCLSIGRSHSILGSAKNALALFSRALDLVSGVTHSKNLTRTTTNKPTNLDVSTGEVAFLQRLLQGLVFQSQAFLELGNLHNNLIKTETSNVAGSLPLIERLEEYPNNHVDLAHLVIYPPRVRPIPVKPLFFDVAWNYIEYPGRTRITTQAEVISDKTSTQEQAEGKKEGRKGWFGFGR